MLNRIELGYDVWLLNCGLMEGTCSFRLLDTWKFAAILMVIFSANISLRICLDVSSLHTLNLIHVSSNMPALAYQNECGQAEERMLPRLGPSSTLVKRGTLLPARS